MPERATTERPDKRPPMPLADDAPVIGMGDHVPMFLLRPVKLKPAKVVEVEEQD
jgi:hypothetical protein